MRTYSQKEIEDLINCPKVITDSPRKEMRSDRGSLRNDMRLTSQDGEQEFGVFMPRNQDFPENFSIGLNYVPKEEPGSFCLLRFNGPHGEFIGFSGVHPHRLYHMHKAKPENMEVGARAERGGESTDQYASYEQALWHFLKSVNVVNAEEVFPSLQQLSLRFGNEEIKP